MIKKRLCEECEGEQGQGSLRDRIWEAQLSKREIIIDTVIDERVVRSVVVQIQNINALDDEREKEFIRAEMTGFVREPITVFVSSPGGDVGGSFAVVSAIEASKTPVVTVAVGEAMSGGFLILLAGHTRYAQRYATLMYHELSSGTGGKATEVREYGEYLVRLQSRITEYVLNNSDITEEALNECHLRKQDWYMDTFEALELGVVDGIWPPEMYELEEPHETGELDEQCVACIEAGEDDCDACDYPNKPE